MSAPEADVAAILAEHRQALRRMLTDWATRHDRVLAVACGGDTSLLSFCEAPATASTGTSSLLLMPRSGPTLQPLDAARVDVSKAHAIREEQPICYQSEPIASTDVPPADYGHNLSHEFSPAKESILGIDLKAELKQAVDIEHHMDESFEKAVHTRKQGIFLVLLAFERLEQYRWFHVVCSVVIFLNAVFLFYATEYRMVNIGAAAPAYMDTMELGFCLFYSTELVVKILAQRFLFIFGVEWVWNLFDCALVVFSLVEMASAGGGMNLSYLRTIRLIKMIKLLRFVRLMRQFHELRMVLDSILGSIHCMFWSMVVIATVTAMFSLAFVQAAADYLADTLVVEPAYRETLVFYWGGILPSMLSLFQASTGGDDWANAAAPLQNLGVQYYLLFMIYVAFFIFVIMNSMTSIFVDSVREMSSNASEEIVRDQMERRKEYMEMIVSLFQTIDSDGSGLVTLEEFRHHLLDAQVQAFADSLEIEVPDLEEFFEVISLNGKKAVDLESFVVGCIKNRGPAKSLGISNLTNMQQAFEISMRTEINRLSEMVAALALRGAAGATEGPPDEVSASSASV